MRLISAPLKIEGNGLLDRHIFITKQTTIYVL
jgi:hypothetical protein